LFECAGVDVVDFGVLVHQQGAAVGFAAGGEIAVFDPADEGFDGLANGVERFDEVDVDAIFFKLRLPGRISGCTSAMARALTTKERMASPNFGIEVRSPEPRSIRKERASLSAARAVLAFSCVLHAIWTLSIPATAWLSRSCWFAERLVGNAE